MRGKQQSSNYPTKLLLRPLIGGLGGRKGEMIIAGVESFWKHPKRKRGKGKKDKALSQFGTKTGQPCDLC